MTPTITKHELAHLVKLLIILSVVLTLKALINNLENRALAFLKSKLTNFSCF